MSERQNDTTRNANHNPVQCVLREEKSNVVSASQEKLEEAIALLLAARAQAGN
jgi:hypothetical protein